MLDTLRRTWREAKQDIQSFFASPINNAACRALALCLTTLYISTAAPHWMHRALLINPFLGFSVFLLNCSVLYYLWKKYHTHLKITIFHLGKWLVLTSKYIFDEFIYFGTDNTDADTKMKRAGNRKLVRTAVLYLMVQHCMVPTSHLVWVHSLLAYVFMRDIVHWAHTQGVVNNNIDPTTVGLITVWKPRLEIMAKAFISGAVLYYQFMRVSKLYLLVTGIYFLLNQHFLEKPLTKLIEGYQMDVFEGLEQYYVMGACGFVEILIAFIFMVWTLVQSGQLIMLIALYTNIFTGGREIIVIAVNAAFKEWLILAQFDRATAAELSALDDVCAICLAPMRSARKTNCKHFFHGHCLRRCLKERLNCPMCSKKLL